MRFIQAKCNLSSFGGPFLSSHLGTSTKSFIQSLESLFSRDYMFTLLFAKCLLTISLHFKFIWRRRKNSMCGIEISVAFFANKTFVVDTCFVYQYFLLTSIVDCRAQMLFFHSSQHIQHISPPCITQYLLCRERTFF